MGASHLSQTWRALLRGRPFALGVVLSMVGCPALPVERPAPVAFVNVTVVPMDRERLLPGQTVVIRDGRIAEIGPQASVKVPDDARRIDAAAKYLMPGLVDAHFHLQGNDTDDRQLLHGDGQPVGVPRAGRVRRRDDRRARRPPSARGRSSERRVQRCTPIRRHGARPLARRERAACDARGIVPKETIAIRLDKDAGCP
jgi:hypothetical protein